MTSSDRSDLYEKRAIGLELDDQAIYFVELLIKKGQVCIQHAEKVDLPNEVIVKGEIKNDSVLNQVLTPLLKNKSYINPVPIVVGISGVRTIVRKLNIPIVPPKEMDKIVHWEGENILPYSIDEFFYSYQVLDQFKENCQILFTAIHKEILKPYIQIFKKSKLPIQNLTIQSFGLVNYVEFVGELVNFSGVLTKIRNRSFDLIVCNKGKIELVRTIPVFDFDQKKYIESFIFEINSTLRYFHSLKDIRLSSGIYVGSREIMQQLRLKMPAFHWRHLWLDLHKIQSTEEIREELVWELPSVLGLGLQELI